VDGSKISQESSADICIHLPLEEVGKFPRLLKFLEDERDGKSELGILSFGISMITLEDIFLKIINDRLEEDHIPHIDPEHEKEDLGEDFTHLLKPSRWYNQLYALLMKNVGFKSAFFDLNFLVW
jgi:hypothetical protein